MHNQGIIKISIALIFLLFSSHALGSSAGISGFSGSTGSSCTTCHNAGTVPTVALSGSNSVTPGSTNSYQFTITITGGQNQIGGLSVSASSGTLIVQPGGNSTKILNSELTQTQPAFVSAGSIVWDFDWQAPTTAGTYTLYAAGVSADNDQSVTGDNAATDSLTITVASAGPTPVAIISSPLTATPDSSVTFDGSASTAPPPATINQYDWNIDGTDFLNSGPTPHITSFDTTGRHTATLTVTDSNNVTATTFADIIIDATTIPVVNHTGPYSGDAGAVINFDVSGSTSDSTAALDNFVWDFGDGSAVEEGFSATRSHTYVNSGNYTATIAAQDLNGMTGVASATVTVNAVISQPTTGEEIYNAKCISCHGPAGTGTTLVPRSIQGATQTLIVNASAGGSNEIPDMSGTIITPADAQLVADYLAVTGSTGDALYIGRCQICHGVDGIGNTDIAPPVIGATREMILNKIISVPDMSGIVLDNSESQLIADFLGSSISSTGSEFYANKCTICHGAAGIGIPGVGQAVKGATQSMILNAFNTIGIMDGIILSNSNAQLVADYLGTGGTTGQEFFANKCAICHGPAGIGGIAPFAKGATNFMINAEIVRVPDMAGIIVTGAQSQEMADYLGSGGTTGQDFYTNKCFICHGPDGDGNSASIYDGESIQGKSAQKYFDAIDDKQEMLEILLTTTEADAIELYLP